MVTYTKKTRLQVQLDTSSSDQGHYDEIVAVSEHMINQSFENIFKAHPELVNIYLDDETYGQVEGTLLPPSILIDTQSGNTNSCYFQLKFNEAKATLNTLKGQKELDMNGWVLSVPCLLKSITVTTYEGDDEETKKEKAKHAKILDQYFVAGDYTPTRLFAALASAKWDHPEKNYSTCGIDSATGKPMKHQDWVLYGNNQELWNALVTMLMDWSAHQETKGLTSIGAKFTLPTNKQIGEQNSARAPTYLPKEVVTQVYPFIDAEHENKVDYTGGINPYNCLLYCEIVEGSGNSLPQQRTLGHTANLAGLDPLTEKVIEGSFILDHRVFLGKYLLPHLQPLCQAVEVNVGKPGRYWSDEGGAISPVTAIGCQLPGTPQDQLRCCDNATYALHYNKEKAQEYIYTQNPSSVCDGYNDVFEYEGHGMFNDYYFKGDSNVKVNWVPGTTVVTVSGYSFYHHRSRWANNRPMTDQVDRYEYKVDANWSFKILLDDTTRSGVMTPRIDETTLSKDVPNDLTARTYDLEVTSSNIHTHDHHEFMRSRLRDTLSSRIPSVKRNITRYFQGASGQLVFPGNGTFVFEDTKLNNFGNVISSITYKPNPDGVKITLPSIEHHEKVKPTIPDQETTHPPKVTGPGPKPSHLEWQAFVETLDEGNYVKLSISAMNPPSANTEYRFKYIRIAFPKRYDQYPALFPPTTKDWKEKKATSSTSQPAPEPKPTGNTYEVKSGMNLKLIRRELEAPISPNQLQLDLGSVDARGRRQKFLAVPPGQSVTVNFVGKVPAGPTAAEYVVQVWETWVDPDDEDKLTGHTWIDLHLRRNNTDFTVVTTGPPS